MIPAFIQIGIYAQHVSNLALLEHANRQQNDQLHFVKIDCAKLIMTADLPDSPRKQLPALAGETEVCLLSSLFKKAVEVSKLS